MNKTLTFHELVKMIHPDSNPNIKDASVKMNLAVQNKGNPSELYRLAIIWGLIEGELPPNPRPPQRPQAPQRQSFKVDVDNVTDLDEYLDRMRGL